MSKTTKFTENESASMKNIAEVAGVSLATVSRALNDLSIVTPETREKVLTAAKMLHYEPNRLAQSLRTKKTNIIGLVLPKIANPVYTELLEVVQQEFDLLGYSLILCESLDNPKKEINYLRLLQGWNAAGIIIAPAINSDITSPVWELVSDRIVQVSRYIPEITHRAVISDNYGGLCKLTEHLVKLGYKRIGFIGGSLNINSGRDRMQGYLDTLRGTGVEVDNELILIGYFSEKDGYRMTKELLEKPEPPEVIISGSNLLTLGSLLALKESGKRIPDEIALACYDEIETGSILTPPLTAVRQRVGEIAKEAVNLLFKLIDDQFVAETEIISIPTDLVVRESCGVKIRSKI